jgi:hypothetical protein
MQLDFLHHTSLWDESRFHLTQTKRRKNRRNTHIPLTMNKIWYRRDANTHTQTRIALNTYIERWKHVIEECTGRNSAATRKLQKKCRGQRTDDRGKEEALYVRPCVRVFPLKLQRLFWICCCCNPPWYGPRVAPISLPQGPFLHVLVLR